MRAGSALRRSSVQPGKLFLLRLFAWPAVRAKAGSHKVFGRAGRLALGFGLATACASAQAARPLAPPAAGAIPAQRFHLAPPTTAPTAAPAAAAADWTLSRALARALQHSRRLRAADAGERAARAAIAAARAGWLPELNVSEGLTRSDDPVFVFGSLLRQHRFGAGNFSVPLLNRPGALNDWQSSVQAQISLWDGGQTLAAMRGARLGLAQSGEARRGLESAVIAEVAAAYFGLRQSRAGREAARLAVEAARASEHDAEARYHAGMAVEADRLSAAVYLARMQQMLAAAQAGVVVARSELNRLLGRPLQAPLPLAAAPAFAEPLPPTLEEWQSRAARLRPDLAQAAQQIELAQTRVRAADAAFWPQVGAFAGAERDQPDVTGAGGSNWMAGVTLHWNLFHGGADAARRKQAIEGLEAARELAASLRSQARAQVLGAWEGWRTAQLELALSRKTVTQAAAALAILRRRYQNGLISISQLLGAETALTRARAGVAAAEYQAEASRAAAWNSMGALTPERLAGSRP